LLEAPFPSPYGLALTLLAFYSWILLQPTESRGYPLCAPSRLPTTPFTAHYDVKPRVISDPAIQPANSESELDANKKAA
jgi:hypothetical protein